MKRKQQFLHKETMVIITIIILVIFLVPACEQNNSPILPSVLIGTWGTDDSRYKNRYIEFYDNRIIFGTGDVESYTLFVNRVTKNIKNPIIEWTFFCENVEGNSSEIVIFYQPATDTLPIAASIRLKNKKAIVWYKTNIFNY